MLTMLEYLYSYDTSMNWTNGVQQTSPDGRSYRADVGSEAGPDEFLQLRICIRTAGIL